MEKGHKQRRDTYRVGIYMEQRHTLSKNIEKKNTYEVERYIEKGETYMEGEHI